MFEIFALGTFLIRVGHQGDRELSLGAGMTRPSNVTDVPLHTYFCRPSCVRTVVRYVHKHGMAPAECMHMRKSMATEAPVGPPARARRTAETKRQSACRVDTLDTLARWFRTTPSIVLAL